MSITGSLRVPCAAPDPWPFLGAWWLWFAFSVRVSWGFMSPAQVKAHKKLKMAILGPGTKEGLEMSNFSSLHFPSWKNVSYETHLLFVGAICAYSLRP